MNIQLHAILPAYLQKKSWGTGEKSVIALPLSYTCGVLPPPVSGLEPETHQLTFEVTLLYTTRSKWQVVNKSALKPVSYLLPFLPASRRKNPGEQPKRVFFLLLCH
jgi:hypothetical protein